MTTTGDGPTEQGDELDETSLQHAQFGSVHVKLGDLAGTKNVLILGLSAAALAYDLPIEAGATVTAAVFERIKRLSLPELWVFDALQEQSGGGNIYRVWVDESVLVRSIHEDMSEGEARRLLASMKSRGILEEGAGQWRAVW